MDIKTALTQLDHSDDSQWTNEGLPQIAVVKKLTGDNKVTRKLITEAAADFRRNADADTGEQTNESQAETEQAAEPQAQESKAVTADGEVTDVQGRYDAITDEIMELQTSRDELDEQIAKLTQEQTRLQPWIKPTGYNAAEDQASRMHYIAQQNRLRMANALGKKLSELTDDKPPQTPLDQHLQNRE